MNSERAPITIHHYPNKVSVEKFAEIIIEGTTNFTINMNNLECIPKEMYPEEWMEIYAKWMEMGKFCRPLKEILGL